MPLQKRSWTSEYRQSAAIPERRAARTDGAGLGRAGGYRVGAARRLHAGAGHLFGRPPRGRFCGCWWTGLPIRRSRSGWRRLERSPRWAATRGPLLLRLKARAGDKEPPVSGQVFDSLLRLEGRAAIEFIADFLRSRLGRGAGGGGAGARFVTFAGGGRSAGGGLARDTRPRLRDADRTRHQRGAAGARIRVPAGSGEERAGGGRVYRARGAGNPSGVARNLEAGRGGGRGGEEPPYRRSFGISPQHADSGARARSGKLFL